VGSLARDPQHLNYLKDLKDLNNPNVGGVLGQGPPTLKLKVWAGPLPGTPRM